jgi:competence ComEA-like helix-hairpin-helix protein
MRGAMMAKWRMSSRSPFQLIGRALFLLLLASSVDAATWSRRSINSLPDSAFASVEVTPEGKKVRRLPHHDHTGRVDAPHLLSALGRIHQVKWIDARNKQAADQHLRKHMKEYKQARLAAGRVRFPVDLNAASVDELMAVPFFSRKTAEAVVLYREKQGRFKSVDELRRVDGVESVAFEAIADLVTVR